MKVNLEYFGPRAAIRLTVETEEERQIMKLALFPEKDIPSARAMLQVVGAGTTNAAFESVLLVRRD